MIGIAIDGPGGAGKSTIAKTLAKKLGFETTAFDGAKLEGSLLLTDFNELLAMSLKITGTKLCLQQNLLPFQHLAFNRA